MIERIPRKLRVDPYMNALLNRFYRKRAYFLNHRAESDETVQCTLDELIVYIDDERSIKIVVNSKPDNASVVGMTIRAFKTTYEDEMYPKTKMVRKMACDMQTGKMV